MGTTGTVTAALPIQEGDAARAPWQLRPFKVLMRSCMKALFSVKIEDIENVPSTPAIICANHLGWTDAFLVMVFFPLEPRIYALGERDVANISRFRHWLIYTLEIMVPLDRTKPLQAVRTMESVLKRGGSLLIFPEGQLGSEEGKLGELQQGAVHLSQVSGVPIVPVGLTGSSDLWLRRKLVVRVGKPIEPSEFTGNLRERMGAMNTELAAQMRPLIPGDTDNPRFKPLRKWLTKLL